MERKRSTRGNSSEVSSKKEAASRRASRRSPARRKSPSFEAIKEASPPPKKRGRPPTSSKQKDADWSPKKSPKGAPASKSLKTAASKSPKKVKEIYKTTSESSSVRTTKTVTLSAGNLMTDDSMSKRGVSLTPVTELSHRSLSRSISIDDRFSHKNDYSDNEDTDRDRRPSSSFDRRSMSRQLQDRAIAFGSYSVILYLILVPLLTESIVFLCSSKNCDFKATNLKKLTNMSSLFNLQAASIYILFTIGLTLASFVPMGRIVEIPTENGFKEYTFNGFATAVLVLFCLIFGEKLSIISLIMNNYLQLCVLAISQAFIVAFWSFIRATYTPDHLWNPFAKSGKKLRDYFMGREISPRWFNALDAKLAYYRLSIITTLVLNEIFLFKAVSLSEKMSLLWTDPLGLLAAMKYDPTTVTISTMVVIYCLDLLIFEHHLTSSFDLQQEGFGALLLIRYAVFPFLISAVPKFVLDSNVVAPVWILAISATIFISGLVIKRLADKLKYAYRLDATHPKFDGE